MSYSRAAVLLAVAVLVACGPLPRPYAPDAKTLWDGPLELADGAGVVVDAEDCAIQVAPGLIEDVVDALARREVPAAAGPGNRGSLWLACTPAVGGALSWSLLDGNGTPLADFGVATAGPDTGDAVARQVVALLEREHAPAAPTPSVMPALLVPPVAGLPNGGGDTLTRAMATALAGAGAPLAGAADNDTLVVLGSVALGEAGASAQYVEVLWEVVEPDGNRLGVVSQANTVPRGAFDGDWAPLAEAIARAGAEGVIDLVVRAKRL